MNLRTLKIGDKIRCKDTGEIFECTGHDNTLSPDKGNDPYFVDKDGNEKAFLLHITNVWEKI
jgi:hypothetical protein